MSFQDYHQWLIKYFEVLKWPAGQVDDWLLNNFRKRKLEDLTKSEVKEALRILKSVSK